MDVDATTSPSLQAASEQQGENSSRQFIAHPLYKTQAQLLLELASSPPAPWTKSMGRCSHLQSGSGSVWAQGSPQVHGKNSRTGITPKWWLCTPLCWRTPLGRPLSPPRRQRVCKQEGTEGRKEGMTAALCSSSRVTSGTSGFIEDLILLSTRWIRLILLTFMNYPLAISRGVLQSSSKGSPGAGVRERRMLRDGTATMGRSGTGC